MVDLGVGKAELRQTGASVYRQRSSNVALDLVALAQQLDDLDACGPTRRTHHAVDRSDDGCLPGRLGAQWQQVAQERDRCVLAKMRWRDAQRIEHTAQRRIGLQRYALGVGRHLVEQVKTVVTLRIAVDHPRAEEERLVLELLVERRLPRAQCSDAQNRRVAVAVRALAQVKANGLARCRQRVPEVEAAARANHMGGGGHHRGDLLGCEHVVVAGDPRPLSGKVLREELQLVAQRPVQADLAVGPPAHLHAPLELSLAGGRHRDRQGPSQQRRTARGLQVAQQVARLLRALVAEIGNALLALGLGAHDLVCVLDPFARDPQRERVGEKARVEREVDGEGEAFGRSEHQLGAVSWKLRALRQCAQDELRLPARAQLRDDSQGPASVLDVPVHPAQHVPLERSQGRLSVALKHQRTGLVQAVDLRLAEAATERAANQPLQLDAAHRAHGDEVGEAGVSLVRSHSHRLQLLRGQDAPMTHGDGAAYRGKPLSGVLLDGLRDVGGHVALGLAQGDEKEHRRPRLADVGEAAHVLVHVACERKVVPGAVLGPGRRRGAFSDDLVRVALAIPATSDAKDLEVGFHRFKRAQQREEASALAIECQPLVSGCLNAERRPGIVECRAEDAVAVHEGDRCPHLPRPPQSRRVARMAEEAGTRRKLDHLRPPWTGRAGEVAHG